MEKVKLIYFGGCPNIENAKKAITDCGLSFEEINQDSLSDGHKYKNYSSPTILHGSDIIYGAKAPGGGCSLGDIGSEIKKNLKEYLNNKTANGSKTLIGGSVGTAGLATFAAGCGGICAASSLPIGAFLASIGLGAISFWLVKIQIPLIALSIIFASIALWKFIKMKKTWQSALMGMGIGALLIFGYQSACNSPTIAQFTYKGEKMQHLDIKTMRERFNKNANKVRIVSLLSPACPVCVEGHDAMKEVFAKHKDNVIHGEMVWLPILGGDNRAIASQLADSVDDVRMIDGWDNDRAIGKAFQKTLELDFVAWDVYFIYQPGVTWEGDVPPKPTFWMHQLKKVDPKLYLNTKVFSNKLQSIIDQQS